MKTDRPRVAITGGTGFVGRHLAERLDPSRATIVSRSTGVDIDDEEALASAFAGCDVVVHCAGINREIGRQTFERVHVEGTRAIVAAARRTGVRRIVMLSFLRARPDCGSPYHETKWAAEETVRTSGIDHTIVKAGMIYGRGDHLVDHVTRTLFTIPLFATVGIRERPIRPVPIDDLVDVLLAAVDGAIQDPTVAVVGAEELMLGEAVRRIARVVRRPVFVIPGPVVAIRALAQLTEWAMVVPLIAKAQARMLAEGVAEPDPPAPEVPESIRPRTPFDDASIRRSLPERHAFGRDDLRVCSRIRRAARRPRRGDDAAPPQRAGWSAAANTGR